GKVVLVTVGAKGIGRMISEAFITNDATVYISGRDANTCVKAVKDLNSLQKGTGYYSAADFSHEGDCKRLAEELSTRERRIFPLLVVYYSKSFHLWSPILSMNTILKAAFPELHILVNNSGATWGAPYDEYPSAAWTKLLTLNVHRVFTITQLLTPLLERATTASDPARIINIGSINGLPVPARETFAYSASKAGLHHLSRALANHLGRPRNHVEYGGVWAVPHQYDGGDDR
ncbi:dehydrogenase with different specificitie, partial [Penicillium mononematosum]|uniref:dehydrogenase with different specificitie n=1 Tax=Penicillium mononematosum TaxID=268346 RepID=UPI00254857DA